MWAGVTGSSMKTLKFAQNLVPLVLSGEKTSTWRMFDEKNLQAGDHVSFVGGGEEFAQAEIITLREKRLGDITSEDEISDGHERFGSDQERLETYRGYYGDRVTPDTMVKMMTFRLTSGHELHK